MIQECDRERLAGLYLGILTEGLIAIRSAARSGDLNRCAAEAEHLHNLPSLIGEEDKIRHLYYIITEKQRFLDWVFSLGDDKLVVEVGQRYLRHWNEIENILEVEKLLSENRQDKPD